METNNLGVLIAKEPRLELLFEYLADTIQTGHAVSSGDIYIVEK